MKTIVWGAVLVALALTSSASEAEETVEWAPFTLAEGVGEKKILAASDALQKGFLVKQRDFIKRELLKGNDGQWVDIVYWKSREDAERAGQNAGNSAACLEYFHLMAGPDAPVAHFEVKKRWHK